jgi:hypothetical protein
MACAYLRPVLVYVCVLGKHIYPVALVDTYMPWEENGFCKRPATPPQEGVPQPVPTCAPHTMLKGRAASAAMALSTRARQTRLSLAAEH